MSDYSLRSSLLFSATSEPYDLFEAEKEKTSYHRHYDILKINLIRKDLLASA